MKTIVLGFLIVLVNLSFGQIFTENFDEVTTPNTPADWTILNENGDSKTWETSEDGTTGNAMKIKYNFSTAMDDWAVTPAMHLTGGTAYRIKFNYKGHKDGTIERLSLHLGTEATAAAMGTALADFTITSETYQQAVVNYTPEADGDFYLGFYGHSEKNKWYLYFDDVVVEEAPTTPVFAIVPASNNFGLIKTGQNSAPLNFTISNDGAGTFEIAADAITITGVDKDNFSLVLPVLPISLASGESCELPVSFTPQTPGRKTAQIQIIDNTKTTHLIDISGQSNEYIEEFTTEIPETWDNSDEYTHSTAQGGYIKSPTIIDRTYSLITPILDLTDNTDPFMTIQLSVLYTPFQANVKFFGSNDKGESWIPMGNTVELNAYQPWTDYTVSLDGLSGNRVLLKVSCELLVSGYSASLQIDNWSMPKVFSATDPLFAVTPASNDFGSIEIGSTSETVDFSISNEGTGTFTIASDGITLTGDDQSQFDMDITGLTFPITLSSGQSFALPVTFSPTTEGSKSAKIQIIDNITKQNHLIDISGQSNPQFAITPQTYIYPATPIDQAEIKSFTIKNEGVGTLQINDGDINIIRIDADQFSLGEINYPIQLASSESVTFEVAFNPTSTGTKSAQIEIKDNITKATNIVDISGEGYTPLTLPQSEEFDDTYTLSWIEEHIGGTQSFIIAADGLLPTCEPQNGNGMLKYECYDVLTGISTALYSPALNMTEDVLAVDFFMYRGASSFDTNPDDRADKIEIYVNDKKSLTDATLIKTIHRSKELEPIEEGENGWYQYSASFENPAKGNQYLVIVAESASGYNMYLDNLTISEAPISSIDGANLVKETNLSQNYPNPFNPSTTINFALKNESVVQLNVYNMNGQVVASLVNNSYKQGHHSVNFNAANLTSGVYYYTLQTENVNITKKMLLVK